MGLLKNSGLRELLAQFESLYTSSPTSQETTDLTTAYNALAAAVTSRTQYARSREGSPDRDLMRLVLIALGR
jgi:hypothetical protein